MLRSIDPSLSGAKFGVPDDLEKLGIA